MSQQTFRHFCIEALERFIEEYEGTIILISHDKKFVDHVSDTIYKIENKKLNLVN